MIWISDIFSYFNGMLIKISDNIEMEKFEKKELNMSKKFLLGLVFAGMGFSLLQANAKTLTCEEQYTNCANSCETRGEHHVDMFCIKGCLDARDACVD